MILESLILGSILYYSYQEYKKEDDDSSGVIPSESHSVTATSRSEEQHLSAIERSLASIVKESQENPLQNTDTAHHALSPGKGLTFEQESRRGMASGVTALTLSLLGFFYYTPIGILSIPFIFYSSHKAYQRAIQNLKKGKITVDTLVSITILGSMLKGLYIIASLGVLVFRFSERLISKVTHDSRHRLLDVFFQQPDRVWVFVNGVEIEIPFTDLKVGDTVVVHAGQVIPADGKITDGNASIDQHMLTGEANPVERGKGDEVFAATIILSGKLYVEVIKTGEESTVAKIGQILSHTIEYKSTVQLKAKTISQQLVSPALIASGIALPFLGVNSALAVMNAHPKNKLMVVGPISMMNYLNLASKQGILIKDGRSLEILNQIDTVIFDKTGTLTIDQPQVHRVYCFHPDYDEEDVLLYAAAAEHRQQHPLAMAILLEAERRGILIPPIEESTYRIGYGLSVCVAGNMIHVGSSRFMDEEGFSVPQALQQCQQQCHYEGHTLVLVAINNEVVGGIELVPTIRPEAREMIRQLRERDNIKYIYIISGDNEAPTRKLANILGVDHYFAEALPEHKAEIIKKLQEEGRSVCFVGDGINDSIALKQAHLSISLRGASTIATDTAQIILMDGGIQHLNLLFDLAHDYNINMKTSFGIMLTPAVLGIGGVFLLGFGIAQTLTLNIIGIAMGVGNAALVPKLLAAKQEKSPLPPVIEQSNVPGKTEEDYIL